MDASGETSLRGHAGSARVSLIRHGIESLCRVGEDNLAAYAAERFRRSTGNGSVGSIAVSGMERFLGVETHGVEAEKTWKRGVAISKSRIEVTRRERDAKILYKFLSLVSERSVGFTRSNREEIPKFKGQRVFPSLKVMT